MLEIFYQHILSFVPDTQQTAFFIEKYLCTQEQLAGCFRYNAEAELLCRLCLLMVK